MRRSIPAFVLFAVVAVPGFAAEPAKSAQPSAEAIEFFEKKVRPVLAEHCLKCHGEKKQQAGLRLDTAEGMKKGTDEGPVVAPGDPDKSKLVKSVRRQGDFAMPPDKPMPPEAVAVLSDWVKMGAPFPLSGPKTDPTAAKSHWAFQPVKDQAVPSTKSDPGSKNPIDRFVLAKLEARGFVPSPRTDRRTLIRRTYLDLTGLPPTVEEVDAFAGDNSPDAFEKLVDRLLASPHYGERWARYWLDIARYSDTKGYVFQEERTFPYAYTYRDYVIRAFNEDKPYDRFLIEQLAADKLDLGNDPRPLAAMGFLTLGRRFLNSTPDIIDDRIDVVARGMMGLTVGCARCHDHKFDPVPTADYYSFYGVFASATEPKELPLIGKVEHTKEYEAFETELNKREQALADARTKRTQAKLTAVAALAGPHGFLVKRPERLLTRLDRNAFTALQKQIDAFKTKSPVAPPRAMVLNDGAPFEPYVFLRGNQGSHGPKVPRQFLQVAAGPVRKPFKDGSGRLELARAIASPDNPLTARVFVNRVWMYHFGKPLVSTPSDFGTRSDAPTHPELLDWLAKRFVEDGWSIKALHKRMMLSAAYQRASDVSPALLAADPENRLLGHANRQRADFEALRDSVLVVARKLDPTAYGHPVDLFKAPYTGRRSVYGYVDRQNLPGTFRAFDFASPDHHSPQRFQTTVPQQALFLMNSPFMAEQARAVAARADVVGVTEPGERVIQTYRAVLGRNPTGEEVNRAKAFVAAAEKPAAGQLGPWELLSQVLLMSNEFAFVD
ncbi:PSD1 and planctomycete cytochrome C domain-containing protein [Fimbriiglobus ruber]|uniref:Cytochrome c domain-containing protein n=1 Tax=Fimbriiglobus ruber TaxID=1908690 RepID=A0A225E0F3_9BACT|nr:PSD1 and planctomycete cytochrome C domain-containing protein [Fimbriiglobus ruber]OWK47071.1 hypothetical protein FRUB_00770 [Fimbriiglobus ruber]